MVSLKRVATFAILAAFASGDEWIGKKVPELAFPDEKGKITAVKSAPGTVTIVDVWAAWCQYCRKSMPHLNELNRALGPYGLRVIGVNIDEKGKEKEIAAFLDKVKVDFPVLYDPEDKISKVFGIDSIPRTLVIDDRQVVRFLDHPGELDESGLISILLKESPEIMSAGDNLPESDPRHWIQRGLMLNDNSQREVAFYLKAIQLDPKNLLAHRFLGVVYEDQKEYDKAIEHLQPALAAAPKDAVLKRYAAAVYVEAGKDLNDNSDREIAYYDHAIALDPANSDAYFAKATVYQERKDNANAIANFRQTLKLNPDSTKARRRIATLLMADGKLDEAKTEFLSLLKDSPDDFSSLQQMASICEQQDQWKEAVHYYARVTSLLNDRLTSVERILAKQLSQ